MKSIQTKDVKGGCWHGDGHMSQAGLQRVIADTGIYKELAGNINNKNCIDTFTKNQNVTFHKLKAAKMQNRK